MEKKKIYLIVLIVVAFGFYIGYSLYCSHIKNNIVFHTYFDDEIVILWGQDLYEKKDEFYHINDGNSDYYDCNFVYDDNKINQVQDLIIEVGHDGVTAKKTFKLIIVDEDKPIIKYTNKNEIVNKDFNIDEYLEVYDQRLLDNEKFYLTKKEDKMSKYHNEGGYYYYTEGIYSNTYHLEVGLNKNHIVA